MTAELRSGVRRKQAGTLVDELQLLRLEAGNPTLTAMSHRVHLSRSSLSDTFTGKRRPSDNTLHRLADYFGVDVLELMRLRAAEEDAEDSDTMAPLSAPTEMSTQSDAEVTSGAAAALPEPAPEPTLLSELTPEPALEPEPTSAREPELVPELALALEPEPALAPEPARHTSAQSLAWRTGRVHRLLIPAKRFRVRATGTLVVVGLFIASTCLLVDAIQVPASSFVNVSSAAPGRIIDPQDGANPIVTRCAHDAVDLAAEERLESTVRIVLKHSPSCGAAWTEIERLDGSATGEFLQPQVFLRDDAERTQQLTVEDRAIAASPLLTVDLAEDTVCALGMASVSAMPRVLWPAVCSGGSGKSAAGTERDDAVSDLRRERGGAGTGDVGMVGHRP